MIINAIAAVNILKINKMEIIKEPLDIDFVVENRLLTKEEVQQISDYISLQKKKKASKNNTKVNVPESKI